MSILRRLKLKFWRTMAGFRHRYTTKYARLLGVQVADGIRFTGRPDFGTEPWLISIGENCLITQNVRFMTHDGSLNIVRRLDEKYAGLMKFGKIVVENDVFIGANAMIMPSVCLGAGSIIAACSCVTKDVPPGEVWGGVPAKKICTVQELADKLYDISLDYRDEVSQLSQKKEITLKVAEAYWNHSHRG